MGMRCRDYEYLFFARMEWTEMLHVTCDFCRQKSSSTRTLSVLPGASPVFGPKTKGKPRTHGDLHTTKSFLGEFQVCGYFRMIPSSRRVKMFVILRVNAMPFWHTGIRREAWGRIPNLELNSRPSECKLRYRSFNLSAMQVSPLKR